MTIVVVPHIMRPTWNRFVVVKEEIKTMALAMAPVILDPDHVWGKLVPQYGC